MKTSQTAPLAIKIHFITVTFWRLQNVQCCNAQNETCPYLQ